MRIDAETTSQPPELRERLIPQVAQALALADGAPATAVERFACLLLADLLEAEPGPDTADVLVDLLAEREGPAEPLLRALAQLGPLAVAGRAAAHVEGQGPPPPTLVDLQAIPLEGSEVLVLALERLDEPWCHAHVILEDAADGPRLVSAALGPAHPGDTPQDVVTDLAGAGTTTYRPAAAEVQRRLLAGVASARAAGVGVGHETVGVLPLIAQALDVAPAEVWGVSAAGGPSTLLVAPGDEAAYEALRQSLVADIETWVRDLGAEPDLEPVALDLLLEAKWSNGHRDLGRWTGDELFSVLLSVSRAGVDPSLVRDLPDAMADALAFLRSRGQLAGEPLALLEQALEEAAAALPARPPTGPSRAPAAAAKDRAKAKRKAARRARRRNR